MFRKCIFWSHLVVGVSVGIVIFIMSATGVLLTYEKQLIDWEESLYSVPFQNDVETLTTDDVLAILRDKHPEEDHFYIQWFNQQGRAIPAWGGGQIYLFSPYSGEVIRTGESWLVASLHFVTDLHRRLAFEGEQRVIGKSITAYSNVFFLFLIISGAYLWLPRRIRWSSIKSHLLFKKQHKNRHAKHFNWHHVFGFWALVPLLMIVSTAAVFHFNWANSIVYGLYGEEVPPPYKKPDLVELVDGKQRYQALFNIAKEHAANNGAEDWHSMWIEFGREPRGTRFYIDSALGNNYAAAYALYLNNQSGKVIRIEKSTDWSKGNQARGTVRFIHTGEYFGVIGQTIAGLASLAACFLVYTGFTLSWRRLVSPYLSRKVRA